MGKGLDDELRITLFSKVYHYPVPDGPRLEVAACSPAQQIERIADIAPRHENGDLRCSEHSGILGPERTIART